MKFLKKGFRISLALVMVLVAVMLAPASVSAEKQENTGLTAERIKQIQPESVMAAGYSTSKIRVSWNQIPGVDGYAVYRADSSDGIYQRVYSTKNPEKLFYINSGRKAGQTWYYKVRGFRRISGKMRYTRYSRAVCASVLSAEDVPPDYVRTEVKRVADSVKKHQNEHTVTFFAVSDLHIDSRSPQSLESARHAGQAIALLRGRFSVDFGVSLGDMTVGGSSTTLDEGGREISRASAILDMGFQGMQNFRTVGNHDPLGYSYPINRAYLSKEELFDMIGSKNAGAVFPGKETDRGYCYKDFSEQKIRVICLNTGDLDAEDFSVVQKVDAGKISGEQMKWFAETLDLSDKEDASEWGILLLSHHPLDWGDIHPATKVLDAYQKGTTLSMRYDGVSILKNYKGKNQAEIIAQIHGHIHSLKVDSLHVVNNSVGTPIAVKRIAVPNACFSRTNEYGQNGGPEYFGIEYGDPVTYSKTAGTAQDTAFCVVTIDRELRKIYLDCYGAGRDRVVSYS